MHFGNVFSHLKSVVRFMNSDEVKAEFKIRDSVIESRKTAILNNRREMKDRILLLPGITTLVPGISNDENRAKH